MSRSCLRLSFGNMLLLSISTWLLYVPVLRALEQAERERIGTLIEQLTDPSFDLREEAVERLRAIGEAAWPLLEPHLKSRNLELAYRVYGLSQYLATFTSAERMQAERWSQQMLQGNYKLRGEGFEQLLQMKLAGLRRIKQLLSAEHAQPELEFEELDKVHRPQRSVTIEARLVNRGSGPFWISTQVGGPDIYARHIPFGELRPLQNEGSGSAPTHWGEPPDDSENPLMNWRAVNAGEKIASTETFELKEVGFYRIDAYCGLPYDRKIKPHNPEGDGTLSFAVNPCIDENGARLERRLLLYVLPDFKKYRENKQATMKLELARFDKLRVGQTIEAEVAIHALASGLRLERNLACYAWYVLIDQKGLPIVNGSIRSILKTDKMPLEQALQVREIQNLESATWPVAFKLPHKPGIYRLLCGYSVKPWKEIEDQAGPFGQEVQEETPEPPDFGQEALSREMRELKQANLYTPILTVLVNE